MARARGLQSCSDRCSASLRPSEQRTLDQTKCPPSVPKFSAKSALHDSSSQTSALMPPAALQSSLRWPFSPWQHTVTKTLRSTNTAWQQHQTRKQLACAETLSNAAGTQIALSAVTRPGDRQLHVTDVRLSHLEIICIVTNTSLHSWIYDSSLHLILASSASARAGCWAWGSNHTSQDLES